MQVTVAARAPMAGAGAGISAASSSTSVKTLEEKHLLFLQRLMAKVGLRHVTGEKAWKVELQNGVQFGCSLNLSPGTSKMHDIECDDATQIRQLRKKEWAEADPTTKAKRLNRLQKSIDGFVRFCIGMDCVDRNAAARRTTNSVDSLYHSANETRFELVLYDKDQSPVDCDPSWSPNHFGLGRYPKQSILAKKLHAVTAVSQKEVNLRASASSIETYLVEKHRTHILEALEVLQEKVVAKAKKKAAKAKASKK